MAPPCKLYPNLHVKGGLYPVSHRTVRQSPEYISDSSLVLVGVGVVGCHEM